MLERREVVSAGCAHSLAEVPLDMGQSRQGTDARVGSPRDRVKSEYQKREWQELAERYQGPVVWTKRPTWVDCTSVVASDLPMPVGALAIRILQTLPSGGNRRCSRVT